MAARNSDKDKYLAAVDKKVRRIEEAKKQPQSWLRQGLSMGMLGLVFIIPVVMGAYLGSWLDERAQGYFVGWTVGLIVLGVIIGGVNVYFYIKEKYLL